MDNSNENNNENNIGKEDEKKDEKEDEEDDDEDDEEDKELYDLLFNKIKLDDNFDDYIIKNKKPIEKTISNKKKINNNIVLNINTEIINKRAFNPRFPPYNKKCLKK